MSTSTPASSRRATTVAKLAELQGSTPAAFSAAEGVMRLFERLVGAELDDLAAKHAQNDPKLALTRQVKSHDHRNPKP